MSTGYPQGQYPSQYPDEVPFNVPGEGDTDGSDADDFVIGGDVTFTRDADEMEAARSFRSPPPGEHEFFVSGFLKAPEQVQRTGYYNGQMVCWHPYKVTVRLACVADPSMTMLDTFDLPPDDPTEAFYYLNASKQANGRNVGFMAEKFGNFISRLGFPFPKGSRIPPDARRIANWKSRRVNATVEAQRQEIDPITGLPKLDSTTGVPIQPRLQIKPFSYRPSQATLSGPAANAHQPRPAQNLAPAPQAARQPAPHAAPMPPQGGQPVPHQAPQAQAQRPPMPPHQHQPQPQHQPAPAHAQAGAVDPVARLRGTL